MRGHFESAGFTGPSTRRDFLIRSLATGMASGAGTFSGQAAEKSKPPEMTISRTPDRVVVRYGARDLCAYQLVLPPGTQLTSESACYFHPLVTPGGIQVTDLAPDDHRHHRGVFLAWVEMQGAKKADFWGWGEPAPTKGRRIVNKKVETTPPGLGYTRFRILNDWEVEGSRMIAEDMRAGVALLDGATVLELTVQLSVAAPVTLARWAFGGFAVRLRKDAEIKAIGPDGEVKRDPPKHNQPESNWPDAPWYGLHSKYGDGKQSTVVVVGRHTHPTTTWHVLPSVGLINPSITAAAPFALDPAKPLVLRYRVMAFDGAPKPEVIARLADSWYHGRQ